MCRHGKGDVNLAVSGPVLGFGFLGCMCGRRRLKLLHGLRQEKELCCQRIQVLVRLTEPLVRLTESLQLLTTECLTLTRNQRGARKYTVHNPRTLTVTYLSRYGPPAQNKPQITR